MSINERRLAIVSGIVLGVESDLGIIVRLSELKAVLSRRIKDPESVIRGLADDGTLKLERSGGGYRVIIQYTPEVKGIYSMVLEPEVTMNDFVKELNYAVAKYANPVTGYADLGLVMNYVCNKLKISESDFDRMLVKAIEANRRGYVLSYGGSHRIKLGLNYYGLIKVIHDAK